MEPKAIPLKQRGAWKALEEHYQKVRDVHLRTLFGEDPGRGERLTAEAAGLYLDYSKNRVSEETLQLLLQLAEESGLRARIDAMFRGESINVTEHRAVLHVALRAPKGQSIVVDARTSSRASTPCWTGWPASPKGCGAGRGRATPATASATSS